MKRPWLAAALMVSLTLAACAPSAEDIALEVQAQEREAEREVARSDQVIDDRSEEAGQERQVQEDWKPEDGTLGFRNWLENQPDEWAASFCTEVLQGYEDANPGQLVETIHDHGIEIDHGDLELAREMGRVMGEFCSAR